MNVVFKALKKELDKVDAKYAKDKESLRKKLEAKSNEYYSERDKIMKEIKKVCPHKKEEYHDTWHPHTRDGDQYHKCKLCGNERKV